MNEISPLTFGFALGGGLLTILSPLRPPSYTIGINSSRHLSNSSRRLLPYTGAFQRIGGILMAGTAIAILLGWDVELQLWLAPWFPKLPL
jgi:hypothetical protein